MSDPSGPAAAPAERELERQEVGIPGFDVVAGGGLPRGRTTLVAGTSGAGKTLFGLQFLTAGARRFGQTGALVTFEERPEDLFANVESLGWNLRGLVKAGRLAVVDATPGDEMVESGRYDFEALAARIRHAVEKVAAERLFIDALDAVFAEFADAGHVRHELARVVRSLRALAVTTLISVERTEEYGPVARRGVEEFVADGVVILRNALDKGNRRRTLEVLKLRGGQHRKGQYPYVIDPRGGVEVVPVSVIEAEGPASCERISLGNEGLDQMTAGGIFRDSLVLVSGATGTGKSLMAAQFVQAGLAAGERAILFCFEENPAQVVRNAASWGMELAAARRAERLRILARYPQRMGLEDLLVQIKRDIQDFEPRRIAVDSMTALEHGSSAFAFSEFTVGLSSLVKSAGIGAFLTSTPLALVGGEGGVSGVELSTVVDGIILLRYLELDGEIRRGVIVLKLRGVAHDRAIREYVIDGQGMRVLQPLHGVTGVLAGDAHFVGDGHLAAGSGERT